MIKIICVCGARPNFMKIAPIVRAFQATKCIQTLLVHTGQHYDKKMSDLFFEELDIPAPDINLEVGSGSHAIQTAEVMKRFEPVVVEYRPDFVLVVGDVNSTIACGLVSVKLGVKLIHVEAGLRSFDRAMPEEINRILTDSISDLLFVTEQSGVDNLRREGISSDKIHLVGNVMVDTLLEYREKAECSPILKQLDLKTKSYAVITLHRPGNVDTLGGLEKIIKALEFIQKDIKLIFPMHPRTRKNIKESTLQARLDAMPNLLLLDPAGYLDFLKLMAHAAVVLTDSGGIQAETTILQVPCITLRDNTEQPVTITEGTNRLAGQTTPKIIAEYNDIKGQNFVTSGKRPCLWDGRAAGRIADVLVSGGSSS